MSRASQKPEVVEVGGAMSARYDVSGDGVLSEEEMSALFTSLGLAKD